jgi:hypothetical protein
MTPLIAQISLASQEPSTFQTPCYIATPDHKERLQRLKQLFGARSHSEILRAAIMALEAPDMTRRF